MLILSAGHRPESPGACFPEDNPDWCEHAEAVFWVDIIATILHTKIKVGIVPTGSLPSKVAWINQQCKNNIVKLAVEIHFNSDESKKLKGSETLYFPGSEKGEALAKILQSAMSSIFPPNRGTKEGWYQGDRSLGPLYLLKFTSCTTLIIEPEFIYNRSSIENNRNIACEVIAHSILDAINSI